MLRFIEVGELIRDVAHRLAIELPREGQIVDRGGPQCILEWVIALTWMGGRS
jgi:hypothetical protein